MSKNMNIYEIKKEEIESVINIAKSSLQQSEETARKYIDDTIKMNCGTVIVAKDDNKIIGFILGTYTEWNKIGNVGLIATVPESRGKGVGKNLLLAFEDWSRNCGVRKIFLDTREDNKVAQIFYIKCGYVPENYLIDYYEDGFAGINFAKKLIK